MSTEKDISPLLVDLNDAGNKQKQFECSRRSIAYILITFIVLFAISLIIGFSVDWTDAKHSTNNESQTMETCCAANDECSQISDCCTRTPALECYQGKCSACGADKCTSDRDCCDGASHCFRGVCVAVMGRPYNVLNKNNLRADIIDNCDVDTNKEYINDLLSEHASIATFNKFSIELMNLGAPLWIIQLSQQAAMDEINHTKIMLNILNKNNTHCVEIGKFPNHEIIFNANCNAISLDVVNGGCFGETESSINTMIKSIEIEQLYSVAIDEIRHSALAWISAKWMIDNCQNIDISEQKWWENKFKQYNSLIIKNMYQTFWNFKGNDYQSLYKIIHDMLYKDVSSIHQKIQN